MKPTEWLLDSGAFATMTPLKNIILNFKPVNDSFSVSVANGHELPVLNLLHAWTNWNLSKELKQQQKMSLFLLDLIRGILHKDSRSDQ